MVLILVAMILTIYMHYMLFKDTEAKARDNQIANIFQMSLYLHYVAGFLVICFAEIAIHEKYGKLFPSIRRSNDARTLIK